jgi:hypothetical protein
MFKENKYSRCYYNIILRAKSRILEEYTESHHILPKSLGGSDELDNLVRLTAREHYICHLLLPKMTSGDSYYKMLYAYTIMSGRKIYGSRKYEFYKKEYAKVNSLLRSGKGNGMWGADRSGEKNTFFGKRHSEETKRKISAKKKGVSIQLPPMSDEHRKKISEARKRNSTKHTFFHDDLGIFIGSTGDLARTHNVRTSEIYKLTKRFYKSYKGWKIK